MGELSFAFFKSAGRQRLRTAKGENPNKLYAIPEILQPIINKEAKLNKVELKKTYLYDLETKAGEEYIFLGK